MRATLGIPRQFKLGGLGAVTLAAAVTSFRQAAFRQAAPRRDPAETQQHGSTVFRGSKYSIVFDRFWDPSGVGRLVVAPRGDAAPTSEDFGEFLDAAGALAARKAELRGGFVAIFDITNMVWPSVLSIPRIVSVLSRRPPPSELREHTEAIAIVQGSLPGYMIDIVVAITKPGVVPLFATSREAAEKKLVQQLRKCPAN